MKELYSALSKAQGEFPPIPKNKEVTKRFQDKSGTWREYKFRYADLDVIVTLIRPVLSKHGLSFSQTISRASHECITEVRHAEGQKEELSRVPIILDQKDMQSMGAAETYAKRYGLCMAFGITSDEDLDANDLKDEEFEIKNRPSNAQNRPVSAVATQGGRPLLADEIINPEPPEVHMPPSKFKPKGPTEPQIKRFYALSNSNKWSGKYADAYVKATFAKSIKDLTRQEYDMACGFMEKTTCTEELKNTYEPFARQSSAVEAMNKVKATYVDHTAPMPEAPWAPGLPDEDRIPF